MNFQKEFDQALSYQQFRDKVEKNQHVLDEVHDQPNLTDADLGFFERLGSLQVLCIGSDWCPDVVHTVPRWSRLAEKLESLQFRIFIREEIQESMPELIRAHVGPGNRERIPIYIFLDAQGKRLCHWSGRCREADRWILKRRRERPYSELPKNELDSLKHDFDILYRERFRRENFEEIKDTLAVAFGITFEH